MHSFSNHLSLRNRIWMLLALLVGSIVLGSVIDVLMLREALWRERQHKTRQLVESGFGVLTHFYERQRKGELSEAAAQAVAIDTIKAMRYDVKEYFWLNDLGIPFPKMIMHPTVSSLDGQLLDGEDFNVATGTRVEPEKHFTPTGGRKNLFVAFTEVLNKGDAGYVTYNWPKPTLEGGVTEERYAKLSYVKKFAPWGWVIGTGIYVDDVDAAVRKQAEINIVLAGGVGIILLLIGWLMARSITQPLQWLTLFETTLAGVGNAVFITNGDAKILWANRSFTQLSGYASKDIIGRTPKLFSSGVHDADFYQCFWQTVSSGKTWRGDIVNARADGVQYTVNQTVTPLLNDKGQVSHYVAVLEDISERKAEEVRIQRAANFDKLTDLPNRGLFLDRLGQALALSHRTRLPGALLFLDLDHFKEVNDQLGHAAGDTLLIAVAQRLCAQVRECDTVARLGGDEFTVILPSLRDSHDASHVADKILVALALPFPIAGNMARIGVSIGIATFPQHDNAVDCINAADSAMYLAKKAGRNRYVFASGEVSGEVGTAM